MGQCTHFLISCTKEKKLEKTPSEKLEDYLSSFIKEWQSQNERFQLKLSDMNVVLADKNTTDHNLTAVINFPLTGQNFNIRGIDFAQGYMQSFKFIQHFNYTSIL